MGGMGMGGMVSTLRHPMKRPFISYLVVPFGGACRKLLLRASMCASLTISGENRAA